MSDDRTSCTLCPAGREYLRSEYRCADCSRGWYNELSESKSLCRKCEGLTSLNRTQCFKCPSNTRSGTDSLTFNMTCSCKEGFFAFRKDDVALLPSVERSTAQVALKEAQAELKEMEAFACHGCPVGGECPPGTILESIRTMDGYMFGMDDNGKLQQSVVHKCLVKALCRGGEFGGDPSRLCPAGYTLPLCGACDDGYYPSSIGECKECHDVSLNLGLLVAGGKHHLSKPNLCGGYMQITNH